MAITDAPTTEQGAPGQSSRAGIVDGWEHAAELTFPNNIAVYHRMRTDAQVAAVMRAVTLPIRRTTWRLDDGGGEVRPEVMAAVELELGLGDRARRRRRREGVSWPEFLRHALLALPYGFMPFEQVYQIGDPAPELAGGIDDGQGGTIPYRGPRQVAHLRKLGPRMPRSISKVDAARDGGLESITQLVPKAGDDGGWEEVTIGVDRLVMFCHDREGADWTGRSILREAYKHYLVKDRLLRLGPIIVERNGMGFPTVTYPSSGSESKALEIARRARAGEEAGAALEEGYVLRFEGVTGSTRDELPLVKYHDEAIGRNALAMIIDLGHDTGAYNLGMAFVELLAQAQDAIADELIAETVTEHVIRDWVELNYGEGEAYPVLAATPIQPWSEEAAKAISELVDKGVITMDDELEEAVRRRAGYPSKPPREVEEEVEGTREAAASPFANVGLPALVSANIIGAEEARNMLGLPPGAPIPEVTAGEAMLSARGPMPAPLSALLAVTLHDDAGVPPATPADARDLEQLQARLDRAQAMLAAARAS